MCFDGSVETGGGILYLFRRCKLHIISVSSKHLAVDEKEIKPQQWAQMKGTKG